MLKILLKHILLRALKRQCLLVRSLSSIFYYLRLLVPKPVAPCQLNATVGLIVAKPVLTAL